ncbi:MAG: VanZ family protein [Bacillota bacterium]|nr:VanZ family protein [Bacillota bacterium]
MKRSAWIPVFLLLILTYYLSSIPGLRVLPVLKQVNSLLINYNLSITRLALKIASHLPVQLDPAKTFTSDFYTYARANPVIIEFMLRKAAHIFLFFLITIAFFIMLRQILRRPGFAVAGAFLAGTLFSFLDEYHQNFVLNSSQCYRLSITSSCA